MFGYLINSGFLENNKNDVLCVGFLTYTASRLKREDIKH